MRNWQQTIQSEFASSPTLLALINAIDEWISPNANFENFYTFIWNVDTALGYGLDLLGRVVVIPRSVALTDFQYVSFGFGEAGDRVGFNQGPFGDGYRTSSTTYILPDDVYRLFILAKAAYNITDGSIPAINAIMMNLFPGRGNAYVVDGGAPLPPAPSFGFGEAQDRVGFGQGPFGDEYLFASNRMTLTYTFDFPMQAYEAAMVQSGVLPRPDGVLAKWNFVGGVTP